MTDTITLIRQQFTDLCSQRDTILAQSMPLREQRDGYIADAAAALAAQVDPLNSQIATVEAPLAPIMVQIAQIATVLNGQTGAQ